MAWSNAAIKEMLDRMGDVGDKILFVSGHNGDPGDTGANELSGGSPAYARVGCTWSVVTSGSPLNLLNEPEFNVPSGTILTYIGFWSASTGPTWWGSSPLAAPLTYSGQGTYTVLDANLNILPGT